MIVHFEAYAYMARAVARWPLRAGESIVEIGAANINGSVRGLFEAVAGVSYLGTDIVPGRGVDRVVAGEALALEAPASRVVCCEVLEHTPRGPEILAAAWRNLRPGGLVHLTAAGDGRAPHSAVDGGALRPGEYYRNVDAAELAGWLHAAGFVDVVIERGHGDVYATARKPEAGA